MKMNFQMRRGSEDEKKKVIYNEPAMHAASPNMKDESDKKVDCNVPVATPKRLSKF